ncbi:MAG: hypothetical protein WCF03_11340 [Nitrososphaeraceae archaeon]
MIHSLVNYYTHFYRIVVVLQFTRKPEMVRRMNEIDYQYSYASPDPVPAGSSAHFDVTLAQSDFANVVPKYFKLCFDW